MSDESLVPPYLIDILERVRHGADFMPFSQVEKQMRKELGDNWRSRFASFEEKPFAAASIGQVFTNQKTFNDHRFRFIRQFHWMARS